MTGSNVANTGGVQYVYDGSGRRVEKIAGGTTTIYVYDAQGLLATEYSNVANPVAGTEYLTADPLGSTRLVTNAAGAVVKRYDYVPFGEEVSAGVGARATADGYGSGTYPNTPDVVSEKFTGKERDSESGLDYFGARYYGSALGRFTSVDPEGASASLFDPQRWNGYSYAVNNPYKFVDRDGEVPLLLVTAGIGAGVGAVGGAAFDVTNQLIQNGWDFSAINGREVAGAAIGGLVSGGLAGLTLGTLPAPATLTTGYLVTSAVVNGTANVVGGEVQRSIDPSASGSAATDLAAGAVGGAVGTKIAYARYPLPNVKKELAIIAQSNRRSLRPQRVADFNRYANQQTIRNNTAGSVTGTSVANFITDLWSDLTSFTSPGRRRRGHRRRV
jgi:RHS repeat-associated protein